jgi:hypothetical protein
MRPRRVKEYKDVCKGVTESTFLRFQESQIARIRKVQEWVSSIQWQKPTFVKAKVWSGKTRKTEVRGIVILPLALNENSLRCKIIAIEEEVFGSNYDLIFILKFPKLLELRDWGPGDAPLIINWEYINPEFKNHIFKNNQGSFHIDPYEDTSDEKMLKQLEEMALVF